MINDIEKEVFVKCKWYIFTAIALFVVALGLLLYPLVGELLSEKYHSDVETTYSATIEDTSYNYPARPAAGGAAI